MDEVADLARELESVEVTYEIQIYSGAPQGFTEFTSERYQKRAESNLGTPSEFLVTNLVD
jgi:hypothetical protein